MERRKPQERFNTPLPITSPLSPEEIALEVAEAARAVALHETESTQSATISRKRQAEFDPPSSTNKIRDTTTDQRAELDASDELTWLMWKQFDQFDLKDTSNRDPKSTSGQPPVSSVTYQNTEETTLAKDIKMSQRLKRRMDEESDYVPDPYPFGFLAQTSPEETSGYQYSDFSAPVMDGLFQTLSMGPGCSPSLPLNKSSPLESMSSQSTDNHLMSGMNPTPSNTSSSLFGTSFGQESVAGDGNISFIHGMNSTNTTNNVTKHEWRPSFVGTSQDNIHPALRDNATIVKPFDFQPPQFAMTPSRIGNAWAEVDQSSGHDSMEEGNILDAPPAPRAANAPSIDDEKSIDFWGGQSLGAIYHTFANMNGANTEYTRAPDERSGAALKKKPFDFAAETQISLPPPGVNVAIYPPAAEIPYKFGSDSVFAQQMQDVRQAGPSAYEQELERQLAEARGTVSSLEAAAEERDRLATEKKTDAVSKKIEFNFESGFSMFAANGAPKSGCKISPNSIFALPPTQTPSPAKRPPPPHLTSCPRIRPVSETRVREQNMPDAEDEASTTIDAEMENLRLKENGNMPNNDSEMQDSGTMVTDGEQASTSIAEESGGAFVRQVRPSVGEQELGRLLEEARSTIQKRDTEIANLKELLVDKDTQIGKLDEEREGLTKEVSKLQTDVTELMEIVEGLLGNGAGEEEGEEATEVEVGEEGEDTGNDE